MEPDGKVTAYTYDKAGNRKTESETLNLNTQMTSYTYNDQNRLVQTENISQGKTVITTYIYDHNGNLKSKNAGSLTSVSASGTNSSGVIVFPSFDVIVGTSTATNGLVIYSYDTFNRLTRLVEGGRTSEYVYNAEDYRVEKSVDRDRTRYLYEADKVVLELDGNGNQTGRNLYGTNLLMRETGAEQYYYMYNGHGDVTALIDDEGNVGQTYYYDAFGNITDQTGSVDNSITYAGYQYDKESGLYYLNARYYDSETARFISEDDPKYSNINDPLSLNLYTYCNNEPIMNYDPEGHWLLDVAFLVADVASMVKDPSLGNAAWIALDVVCFIDPTGAASSASHAVKVGVAAVKLTKEVATVAHEVDKAKDAVKVVKKVESVAKKTNEVVKDIKKTENKVIQVEQKAQQTKQVTSKVTNGNTKSAILSAINRQFFNGDAYFSDHQFLKRLLNQLKALNLLYSFWSKEKSSLYWGLTTKGQKVRDDMILIRQDFAKE